MCSMYSYGRSRSPITREDGMLCGGHTLVHTLPIAVTVTHMEGGGGGKGIQRDVVYLGADQ